jgi:hypothetical protein
MKSKQEHDEKPNVTCCLLCNGTENLNKHGLCPFCQLDQDLNFYDN